MGKYAPTTKELTKESSEMKPKELVSDVQKYESEVFECIEAWCSFESRLTTEAQKELCATIENKKTNSWMKRSIHSSLGAHRVLGGSTRALKLCAPGSSNSEFSTLKALFDEDNQAWEAYSDKMKWLSLYESHTSNVKVKKKVERRYKLQERRWSN